MSIKRIAAGVFCAALLLALSVTAFATNYGDVAEDAWYAGAVEYCAEHELMDGVGDGRFAPEQTVTRAMAITVLWRLSEAPLVIGADYFNDVEPGSWYETAVSWAARVGITHGTGDGRFGVYDPLTREQLATLLWRYAGAMDSAESEAFADDGSIAAWAGDAVRWARSVGVIGGMPGNLFEPKGSATRAQLAAVLMNFSENVNTRPAVLSEMDVMCAPSGIMMLEDGALLVTDTFYKVVWRVQDGVSEVFAGANSVEDLYGMPLGGYNDAIHIRSLFRSPWGITPFLDGWAVSDPDNDVVRLIRPETVETVNARTKENLKTTELGVAYSYPTGLATDVNGNLYISDTHNGAIRVVTPEGDLRTYIDGLKDPMGICWYKGSLYVAETGAHRILRVNRGEATVIAGSGEEGFADGAAESAMFSSPQNVLATDQGIFIADTANGAVRRLSDGWVDTMIAPTQGRELESYPVSPIGLLVKDGRLFICDNFARKVFTIPLN